MTFYEELGVPRSASTEEIHQAYKALARLLHPDQCADAGLRRLAETQMKRLNQMLEVLSDPEQRRLYDASLDWKPPLKAIPPPKLAMERAGWVWLLVSAVAAGAIILFLTFSSGEDVPAVAGPQTQNRVQPAPPPKQTEAATAAAVPEVQREVLTQPSPTPLRPEPAARQPERPPVAPPPATESAPAAKPPDMPPAESPVLPAAQPRFAGNWFYVPGSPRPTAGPLLYPPEYIEVRLAQDGANLRGRYRARYQVRDQAISPEVSFEFQGAGQEPLARLPWSGPGGASGEIVLKLLSTSALEVSWKAFRISDELSLTSGRATLVRQRLED